MPEAFVVRVEDEMRWLVTLPWGTACDSADPAEEMSRFTEGMRLMRGWAGDDAQLVRGVELLIGCRSALAWTSAAEAALQLWTYELNVSAPAALTLAEEAAELAMARARRAEADALLGELRARGMVASAEPLPPARHRRAEAAPVVVK